jgi:S-methylmethionine-dependent homocysteine/selenocysteine methylase
MTQVTLLDGPLGTELEARGISTAGARWSAMAIEAAPEVIAAIHRDYAEAGATVHTANTFRTKRRQIPDCWEALAHRAVAITRGAVPRGHRVAGSIAPLEDCYRPDLSPAACREEHRELAQALAAAGVDLLLCEAFPHVGEALVAVEEAARTGLPTWVAFTAGPEGTLLSPEALAGGAREAVKRGASAVLVNCTAATLTERFVAAIAGLPEIGAPFGAYANAGSAEEGLVREAGEAGAASYAELAARWMGLGATILGACCGTGPAHLRAIARRCAHTPG